MQENQFNKRIRRLIIIYLFLVLIAVGYCFIGSKTGFRIPCGVHTLTGLNCPGCGITRMIFAISRFDFKSAYEYNRFAFLSIPVFIFYFIRGNIQYVKHQKVSYTKKDTVFFIFYIIIMLLFGVARNIDVIKKLLY